jgi:hypothetical protein
VRIGTDNAYVAFVARLGINLVLVLIDRALLGANRLDLSAALFFVAMLSLLTLLHDRYLPVHAVRVRSAGPDRFRPKDEPAPLR